MKIFQDVTALLQFRLPVSQHLHKKYGSWNIKQCTNTTIYNLMINSNSKLISRYSTLL